MPLRILTWGGRWEQSLAHVIGPFEERASCRVELVRQVGLGLPAELERALESGSPPPVDLVWAGASVSRRAAEAGYTVPLDGLVSGLGELRARAAPEALRAWPIVHPYIVQYVLVFRRDCISGIPTSWDELEKETHRGRVALYPDGNGFFPIAQILGGGRVSDIPGDMNPCWRALERLAPNVGFLGYSPALVEPMGRSRISLAFRTLPNALGFQDDGLDVDWVAPREGVSDTVDALWIPRGNRDAAVADAAAFIETALSRSVQQAWCERLGVMPVHAGAERPSFFDRGRLPRDADDLNEILYVSELEKYRHESEWTQRFRKLLLEAPLNASLSTI
jgi:putative spermidine/putrescine transport system substrate-binding protein